MLSLFKWMTGFTVLLGILGLLIFFGPSSQRTITPISIVIGLAVFGLSLLWLFLRHVTQVRQQQALDAVHLGQPLEVPAAPGHVALKLLPLLFFLAMLWLAITRDSPDSALVILGLAVIPMMMVWHLLWHVLKPGPMLRIDSTGINHARFGLIPWEHVDGVVLRSVNVPRGVRTIHTLYLRVSNPAPFVANGSALTRWLHRDILRYPPRFHTLSLPLNPLDADPWLITTAARHFCRRHPQSRFLPEWTPEMTGIEIVALRELRHAPERIAQHVAQRQALAAELIINTEPPQQHQLRQRWQALDTLDRQADERIEQGLEVTEMRSNRVRRNTIIFFIFFLIAVILRVVLNA